MTTFNELLATFEKDLARFDQAMAEPIPEERECTGCNEAWPLDSEFFYKNKAKPHGFDTRCKACVSEAREFNVGKHVVRARVMPAAHVGTLSLFVPKGQTKFCDCCDKELPLSSAFWLAIEPGEFSGNCLSCISFVSKKMGDGELVHAN